MPEVVQRHLQIKSDVRNLKIVREFVAKAVADSALKNSEANKVILAVDESVANIVRHAYKNRENGRIDIEILADEEKFQVIISDRGEQKFKLEEIKDINIQDHVRLGKRSGMGIFLTRKAMDEVVYKADHVNTLTLVKYIH